MGQRLGFGVLIVPLADAASGHRGVIDPIDPLAPGVPQRVAVGHDLHLCIKCGILKLGSIGRLAVAVLPAAGRSGLFTVRCDGLALHMPLVAFAHAGGGHLAVVVRPHIGRLAPVVRQRVNADGFARPLLFEAGLFEGGDVGHLARILTGRGFGDLLDGGHRLFFNMFRIDRANALGGAGIVNPGIRRLAPLMARGLDDPLLPIIAEGALHHRVAILGAGGWLAVCGVLLQVVAQLRNLDLLFVKSGLLVFNGQLRRILHRARFGTGGFFPLRNGNHQCAIRGRLGFTAPVAGALRSHTIAVPLEFPFIPVVAVRFDDMPRGCTTVFAAVSALVSVLGTGRLNLVLPHVAVHIVIDGQGVFLLFGLVGPALIGQRGGKHLLALGAARRGNICVLLLVHANSLEGNSHGLMGSVFAGQGHLCHLRRVLVPGKLRLGFEGVAHGNGIAERLGVFADAVGDIHRMIAHLGVGNRIGISIPGHQFGFIDIHFYAVALIRRHIAERNRNGLVVRHIALHRHHRRGKLRINGQGLVFRPRAVPALGGFAAA